MKISGIDHVVIKVSDLDRSIRFYCDILGCEMAWRRDELALVHLRAGSTFIDLVAKESLHPAQTRNMDHLCLTVIDFDAEQIREELLALGVTVGATGDRFGASGWGKSIYVVDPDGNDLELRG